MGGPGGMPSGAKEAVEIRVGIVQKGKLMKSLLESVPRATIPLFSPWFQMIQYFRRERTAFDVLLNASVSGRIQLRFIELSTTTFEITLAFAQAKRKSYDGQSNLASPILNSEWARSSCDNIFAI